MLREQTRPTSKVHDVRAAQVNASLVEYRQQRNERSTSVGLGPSLIVPMIGIRVPDVIHGCIVRRARTHKLNETGTTRAHGNVHVTRANT